MQFRLWIAAAALCVAGAQATRAQDDNGSERHKLDIVLAVLRAHSNAAGKPCLDAITRVHQTEDQVSDLSKEVSNGNKSDNGADIARDVLDSDYETAQGVCRPDAQRACATDPNDKSCLAMNRASAQ